MTAEGKGHDPLPCLTVGGRYTGYATAAMTWAESDRLAALLLEARKRYAKRLPIHATAEPRRFGGYPEPGQEVVMYDEERGVPYDPTKDPPDQNPNIVLWILGGFLLALILLAPYFR